jgi:regulator of sigma E protease
LLDGFGAKEAGLEVADEIIAVDGQPVAVWDELQKIIQDKKTQDYARISFLRSGKELSVNVRIKEKQLDDQLGQKRKVGLLGISAAPDVIIVKHSFGNAFFLAAEKCLSLTVLTYKGLWRMITGRVSIRDSVSGPLGMFYITSQAASLGIIVLLHLLAVLSVSLAIFNLLPLPVLDGGHILLLGLEKVRGKNLGIKTEQAITKIGLTLIISLAVLVTYNDILRLYADKIAKFIAK